MTITPGWPRPAEIRRIHNRPCTIHDCDQEGAFRVTDPYGGSHGPYCWAHAEEDRVLFTQRFKSSGRGYATKPTPLQAKLDNRPLTSVPGVRVREFTEEEMREEMSAYTFSPEAIALSEEEP